MVIPVVGLMMGMTLRVRLAAGWLKLTWLGLAATLAPTLAWTKALVEAGEREMAGVTCCTGWIWCCRGEVSGEPLESEERSDEAEWMECSYKIKMSTTNTFERFALLLLPMFLFLADRRSPLTAGRCFDRGRART